LFRRRIRALPGKGLKEIFPFQIPLPGGRTTVWLATPYPQTAGFLGLFKDDKTSVATVSI
jgi:hypothetical protein